MKGKSDLEMASEVYFGDFVSIDRPNAPVVHYMGDTQVIMEPVIKETVKPKFIEAQDRHLVEHDTPEDICILKDSFAKLSAEARVVMRTIYDLPDELFTGTGRVINKFLVAHMKNTFGWSAKKTSDAQIEIQMMLR